MGLQLAYSANAYMKFPIEDAIKRVADCDYRGIEIMADQPHAWPATTTDAQIAAIHAALDNTKLTISNINAFMMNAVQDFWHPSWIEPDESFRRQRVDHTIAALKMAAKLNAPSITTEPGGPLEKGMTRAAAMDTFVEGLTEALKMAENEGVLLLVEPEPDLLVENADQFLELAQRVNSKAFGLNFDVGHFFCVGDPLPETVKRLKDYIKHVHLEDIAATRVHEHLIPGHGAIDFLGVISALKSINYDGWLTVELYPYLDDPDAAGREAREYLLPLIEV